MTISNLGIATTKFTIKLILQLHMANLYNLGYLAIIKQLYNFNI